MSLYPFIVLLMANKADGGIFPMSFLSSGKCTKACSTGIALSIATSISGLKSGVEVASTVLAKQTEVIVSREKHLKA